jgi:hypothetical protein
MPLEIHANAPTMLVRRDAFERAGLVRADIDARFNLTADEFRVEGELIAIGPLYDENAFGDLTEQLESLGLVYFDDFFEMTGNWPAWIGVFALARAT